MDRVINYGDQMIEGKSEIVTKQETIIQLGQNL